MFRSVFIEDASPYEKVMHWFFAFPSKKFSLTDLVRKGNLPISKTSAHQAVRQLEKEGFLHIERAGKTLQISTDTGHSYHRTRKISYHLRLISESGVLEHINERHQSKRMVALFGSYRKGDDIETSDVDIAVELYEDDGTGIEEPAVIPRLGYRGNVPVQIHCFSRTSVNINLFNNIANGIVLDGFLEVRA